MRAPVLGAPDAKRAVSVQPVQVQNVFPRGCSRRRDDGPARERREETDEVCVSHEALLSEAQTVPVGATQPCAPKTHGMADSARPVTVSPRVRAQSTTLKVLRREMRETEQLTPGELAALKLQRPSRRSDCMAGPRPCMFISCRHHLYLDVNPRNGSIKLNFPNKEIWELEETCALDVAQHENTLEVVGRFVNLTRERVRQIENRALKKWRELVDGDPRDGRCP